MKTFSTAAVLIGSVFCIGPHASAVSPESIQQGRQLFERSWSSQDPRLGSDGLGPVFNSDSCVACHHQGGVGGSGDSRFNAQAIGIESIQFSAERTTAADLRVFLRSFYPGFVQPDGSMLNTAALPHHSVAPQFAALRESILKSAMARSSEEGGPESVDATRLTSATPIIFGNTIGENEIRAKASLFQRNTTSLFGAGLIDSVEDSLIQQQAKIQKRHPEISGRASILRDGQVGRFGWRANVSRLAHFVDRACANELGLETKRRRQPVDPTRPNYRNTAIDVDDDQIDQMSEFIASLPAPDRQIPEETSARNEITRGEAAFDSVGCAVCHIPTLGPATGIYSDLLLHDMGPYLYDYDAAEPYVVRQNVTREVRVVPESIQLGYYGNPTSIAASTTFTSKVLESPRRSTETKDYVPLYIKRELGSHDIREMLNSSARLRNPSISLRGRFRDEVGFERQLQPSNTAQEWRTPPLWGLRDSPPYMHDGRAETVLEAIAMHDGESAGTRDRFLQLPLADRQAILAFLETLVAPPNVPQPAR